jgi:predicted TPR repeat methyltransferase
MTNIYLDGEYLENNPSWDAEDSPWKAEQIAAILERNAIVPETIGEIGCGAGGILVELQRRYPRARLKGYDISPQAIGICREKANETLSFELADLTKSRDARFDLLLVIDVLEHVDDYPGFLASIRDLSEIKVFHIPLDMTIINVMFKDFILKQRRTVGHIHYFMKDTALVALEESGYEIVDWCYTPGYSLPHDFGWKERLLRIPRRLCYPVSRDLTARIFGGYSLLVLAR